MKLLYIANARIPTEKAHGLQITKMCEAFAKLEGNIDLVVPYRIQTKILKGKNAFGYYGVERIFNIKKLPVPDLIYLTGFLPGKISIALFHIHGVIFSFFVLFYSLIKNPNIIFTRDSKVAFLLSFFKPVVYESHTHPSSNIDRFFERSAFKRCKFLITITRNLKDIYARRGFGKKKIHVLHDGVDIDQFDVDISKEEARKKLNLDAKEKLISYIGHLYPWKGVYTLVDASKFLNAKVILVGGLEKDVKKIREYISKKNMNNVVVIGHVGPNEVPIYLKAADVLVLPNSAKDVISMYYTSPLKLFEYMASKRPIVASNLPSIREILNEDNAVLVEPDDPEALAQGIDRVLKDQRLASKVGQKAHEDVMDYTWEKRAERILQELCNGGYGG